MIMPKILVLVIHFLSLIANIIFVLFTKKGSDPYSKSRTIEKLVSEL